MPRINQTARKSTATSASRQQTASTGGKRAIGQHQPQKRKSTVVIPITRPANQRFRPGERALAEIRTYQKSVHNLIPRLSFQRLVREVMLEQIMKLSDCGVSRIQAAAFEILLAATEAFLTTFIENANSYAKRVTVMKKDFDLAKRIRGERV